MASLVAQMVKNIRRPRFNCWVRKISWNRKWQPAPVFLPREQENGLVARTAKGEDGMN